jgi:hypothetical protein
MELSPFRGVRMDSFTFFNEFLRDRYHFVSTMVDAQRSALHNPEYFAKLRLLYAQDHVEYAMTEVADPRFYKLVKQRNPKARNWTVSVSNIFDMDYNDRSFSSLQSLMRDLLGYADASPSNPVTIFETKNGEYPHEFFRYELGSLQDIPTQNPAQAQPSVPGLDQFIRILLQMAHGN